MGKYRIERSGNQITIWDDHYGVGLRFQEGESLQRYESSLVLVNPLMSGDETGMAIIRKCEVDLTEYAAEGWPEEFKELKSNQ